MLQGKAELGGVKPDGRGHIVNHVAHADLRHSSESPFSFRFLLPVDCIPLFNGAPSDQAYFLTAFSIALPALARSSGIMTG